MLKYLLVSARPKQWYKNILLFAGIIFSLNLLQAALWLDVILAFTFFCMLSASEYLINDSLRGTVALEGNHTRVGILDADFVLLKHADSHQYALGECPEVQSR
jgi:hypothetical protein